MFLVSLHTLFSSIIDWLLIHSSDHPLPHFLDYSIEYSKATVTLTFSNEKLQAVMTEVLTEFDEQWNMKYEKLVEFERQNGHCIVPLRYEKDTLLGKWVSRQQINHTNKTLRQERKELLDKIGFTFAVCSTGRNYDKKWHDQYEKLAEWQEKNGHCVVPQKYKEDRILGRWVDKQRALHTRKKLLPHREELLNEIGFVWKVNKTVDKSCEAQLIEITQHNGHRIGVPQCNTSFGKWFTTQPTLPFLRSPTTDDVRGLIIIIISRLDQVLLLTSLLIFMLDLCRIWK